MTLVDDELTLPSRLVLAVRRGGADPADGAGAGAAPFLLVHGLASNARVWDGVAQRLVAAGHEVVAVDLRGHGRSPAPDTGYSTAQAAADLAELVGVLGWTGQRAPVVAGQSWGGNVVLELTARHDVARAVALLDGGWIWLGRRFATFEDCWAVLAPPVMTGWRYDDVAARIRSGHPDWPTEGVEGTLANLRRLPDGGVRAHLDREHHRSILHSLWADDPRSLFGRVHVPTLLMPAAGPDDAVDGVRDLLAAVPSARVRWYPGADHDLHAQHPDEVAADLLSLLEPQEAAS
ncbi:alpha/beta hydrolase [Angustibacter peucedani]